LFIVRYFRVGFRFSDLLGLGFRLRYKLRYKLRFRFGFRFRLGFRLRYKFKLRSRFRLKTDSSAATIQGEKNQVK